MTLSACPIHDDEFVDERGRGCKPCAAIRKQFEKRVRMKRQHRRAKRAKGPVAS
jgi:hypothetical protein